MTFLWSERPQTISDIVGTDLTSLLRCSLGSLLWHSRLARRTYIQYGRLPSQGCLTEKCEGREFEAPQEQSGRFLPTNQAMFCQSIRKVSAT